MNEARGVLSQIVESALIQQCVHQCDSLLKAFKAATL